MMRVLFLDDRDERIKWGLEKYGRSLFTVRTADGAIAMLSLGQFDLVSLDHDLNHEVLMDSNRKDSGMEVVRWIVVHKPVIPRIIIHSANNDAALRMVMALTLSGYDVVHEQAGA